MFWEVSLKYEHCPEGRGFLHVSVFCGFSGGGNGTCNKLSLVPGSKCDGSLVFLRALPAPEHPHVKQALAAYQISPSAKFSKISLLY